MILRIQKCFRWFSKSRARVIFVSESLKFFFCQWVSESQICRFFCLFGLQKSNYSEFMGIQFNQTELVEKKRLKQDRAVSLEGLLLASIAIYGHFIWLYL